MKRSARMMISLSRPVDLSFSATPELPPKVLANKRVRVTLIGHFRRSRVRESFPPANLNVRIADSSDREQ
jgi:hypothetical protein